MANKSKYVTETGVDFFNNKFHSDRTLTYDLISDDNPIGFGKTVTPRAANAMIKQRITETVEAIIKAKSPAISTEAQLVEYITDKLTSDRVAIEYGRETLLRILSQEDCVGIRFANCKNSNGKNSIVAIGITSENINGKLVPVPLKKGKYLVGDIEVPTAQIATFENDPSEPLIEEEGNGSDSLTLLSNMGISVKDLLKDITNESQLIENISTKITKSFFGIQ